MCRELRARAPLQGGPRRFAWVGEVWEGSSRASTGPSRGCLPTAHSRRLQSLSLWREWPRAYGSSRGVKPAVACVSGGESRASQRGPAVGAQDGEVNGGEWRAKGLPGPGGEVEWRESGVQGPTGASGWRTTGARLWTGAPSELPALSSLSSPLSSAPLGLLSLVRRALHTRCVSSSLLSLSSPSSPLCIISSLISLSHSSPFLPLSSHPSSLSRPTGSLCLLPRRPVPSSLLFSCFLISLLIISSLSLRSLCSSSIRRVWRLRSHLLSLLSSLLSSLPDLSRPLPRHLTSRFVALGLSLVDSPYHHLSSLTLSRRLSPLSLYVLCRPPSLSLSSIEEKDDFLPLFFLFKFNPQNGLASPREGFEPEEVEYYSSGNYGPDANRTFDFNGIVIFSDANVGVIPSYAENRCNKSEGYSPCLVGGCYPSYKRCDGIQDCTDGYDEISCLDPLEDREEDFRIHRYQKFSDFFDAEDGDWLWLDINIGHKGHEQNLVEMPKVDDPYVLNAFSVSKEFGFGLAPAPQWYSIIPPVYVSLEMPDSCRRGEQVGIRVMVFNNIETELLILLVLHGSDDHRFIMVEETGVVDFYRPRTMAGDHQHLVSVPPESAMEVIFPVVATIDQGEIELTVSAISQIGRDEETVTLIVEPEGATIDRHTSILLDLKNRALVYEYMDIIVEESYVIPLQIRRRFVAGSPRGHVSLCGDVVGPSFPNDEPVDSVQMLRKELRGTEASTFNFGANLWTLHYLRLTNQLDISERQDIFDQLNVELAAIMYRFSSEGSFKMWDTSQPSVWLTAWTTRTIQMAQFQDWENIIYIEPRIISKAIEWLIKYQTPSGAFMETPAYQAVPLDKKADAYSYGYRWRGARNITLTAQCLITLERTINSLQGNVRADANNAKIQAVRYLERELRNIRDPYEVAIVAYALSVSNSVEKEAAFNQLDRIKREENGLVYWSRSPVQTNKRVYENNQRNLLQPKFEEEWDSHAVEASSYALLVYLIRDGVNIIQERIVEWLNAMRMHDGGFISTVDTLVALEALTEYSYRARLRDLTDMRVTVEATGEEGRSPHNVVISNSSIKNVWGLVNVVAHGAGQAILQLDVSYGIDWTDLKKQPPVDAFKMVINERYSKFRNKSICNVEICARWTNLEESPQSSAAVIEVEVPTGYVAYQLDLERSIYRAQMSGNFPSLRDVIGGHGDTFARKTVWFFDYIPGNTTWCFEYVMKRWYPVANLTRVRMATIYEQYQPERFQMVMLNSTVNTLDVCEVCGSYQCPYCPIYSSAPSLNLPNVGFLISVALVTYAYQVFSESRSFAGSRWPGGSGSGGVW
ncbi:hypothetical protein C7M84_023454 [Penaeus vannamei]|uniref:CD109 antigen n=1 Tax=Penaeus vannamei TaxID=6689 RepID=A0A423U3S6_PENVA|nr:hypothetical protein C7M84_023454 [Penaeus vannamei]